MLAGNHQNSADRAANLSDHRRGVEGVVLYRACEPKRVFQRGGLNRDHLHMRHLILRNGKELRGGRGRGVLRERRHSLGPLTVVGVTGRERKQGSEDKRTRDPAAKAIIRLYLHGMLLVPTAWRSCS